MGMGNTVDKKMAAVKPASSDVPTGAGRESQTTTAATTRPSPPRTTEQSLDWNVDMEVQLFYAMRGHKPVGVNRHFQMACIHEKFRNSVQKDVTSQQIWDHLDTMYDMAALHESEIVPFPNDELEFVLPDEFAKQIEQKIAGITPSNHGGGNDEATNGTIRSGSKESTAVDEKEATKAASMEKSVAHQGGKQTSSSSNKSKENRTSAPQSSAAAMAASDGGASGGQEARSQAKRKRNMRTQLDQQSGSKPSSPASGSSTPASAKRRRN